MQRPENTHATRFVQNAFTQHAASLHLYTRILFFETFIAFFLLFLQVLDWYLAVLQGSQCACQYRARTEDDLGFLDEGIVVFLFGEGTFTAEGYDDSLIKKAKIIFRPGTILADALESLKYSKVPIKYPKEEKEENNDGFEE